MVVKQNIKNELLSLIEDLNSGDVTKKNPKETIEKFAEGLATIIENGIKSASVNVTIPPGLVSQGISPSVVLNITPLILKGNLS